MIQQPQNEILELQVYFDQVSGKQPKLLTADHSKLLKGFNQQEDTFYQKLSQLHVSHPMAAIKSHIPKYHGVLSLDNAPTIKLMDRKHEKSHLQWLSHLKNRYKARNQANKFIVLENLTSNYEYPNIFDIKIGGRNVQGKLHKITETVSKYFIKLNGCKIMYALQDKTVFLSKYYLHKAKLLTEIIQYLALFFFDGQQLAVEAIIIIQQQLVKLILSFKAFTNYRFISSSLCLFFDSKCHSRASIKFIDFGRVNEMPPGYFDKQSCAGMQNVVMILNQIIQRRQQLEHTLQQKKHFYCTSSILVIPDHKKQHVSTTQSK